MIFLPEDPTGFQMMFWVCALGGTLFFLLRVVLVLVVGFGADDMDTGVDGHGDAGVDAHDVEHTDAAFKLLSLNTISAFIMMFGWSGLTSSVEFNLGSYSSIVIASVVGIGTMYATGWFFRAIWKLSSSGADFKLEQAIGQTARVYSRIPVNGIGKIHIKVNGLLREVDASGIGTSEIESFVDVVVKEVKGSTAIVERK